MKLSHVSNVIRQLRLKRKCTPIIGGLMELVMKHHAETGANGPVSGQDIKKTVINAKDCYN